MLGFSFDYLTLMCRPGIVYTIVTSSIFLNPKHSGYLLPMLSNQSFGNLTHMGLFVKQP